MSNALVAQRYARALRDVGMEAGIIRKIDDDVALISETVGSSRDLKRILASSIVSRERKKTIAKALFGERIHPKTAEFVGLLVEKGRADSFLEVASAYREFRDREEGVVEVTARTAAPLEAASQEALKAQLERRLGKRVRLRLEIVPSLIGGLVVRVGDIVYDGSISNRLARLREQFSGDGIRRN